jgi:hypothetical protein
VDALFNSSSEGRGGVAIGAAKRGANPGVTLGKASAAGWRRPLQRQAPAACSAAALPRREDSNSNTLHAELGKPTAAVVMSLAPS